MVRDRPRLSHGVRGKWQRRVGTGVFPGMCGRMLTLDLNMEMKYSSGLEEGGVAACLSLLLVKPTMREVDMIWV